MHGPDYKAKIAEFNRRNASDMADGLTAPKRARIIERMDELDIRVDGRDSFLEFIDSDTPAARVARQLHYAKSPLRQNVCEIAFLEFAEKALPDLDASPLPKVL